MTAIEEKTYKTLLDLYREVMEHEHMISYYIHNYVKSINKLILEKSNKNDNKEVTIPYDDFVKITEMLNNLSSEDRLTNINSSINLQYITPKEIKLGIIKSLS